MIRSSWRESLPPLLFLSTEPYLGEWPAGYHSDNGCKSDCNLKAITNCISHARLWDTSDLAISDISALLYGEIIVFAFLI